MKDWLARHKEGLLRVVIAIVSLITGHEIPY